MRYFKTRDNLIWADEDLREVWKCEDCGKYVEKKNLMNIEAIENSKIKIMCLDCHSLKAKKIPENKEKIFICKNCNGAEYGKGMTVYKNEYYCERCFNQLCGIEKRKVIIEKWLMKGIDNEIYIIVEIVKHLNVSIFNWTKIKKLSETEIEI